MGGCCSAESEPAVDEEAALRLAEAEAALAAAKEAKAAAAAEEARKLNEYIAAKAAAAPQREKKEGVDRRTWIHNPMERMSWVRPSEFASINSKIRWRRVRDRIERILSFGVPPASEEKKSRRTFGISTFMRSTRGTTRGTEAPASRTLTSSAGTQKWRPSDGIPLSLPPACAESSVTFQPSLDALSDPNRPGKVNAPQVV
mmetsp:Transcript_34733/g.69175  ORF Transcript_34733/g.69175 Transcript_34733/m.69175 type:complete len:201 (-) Transcript_34733:324-926(-)|eukprot:CAMPEP_0174725782 /NCGR_PEP_ID=MMETSP1094-20130205/46394_1 /TAXON_ID=156173 /ORGANISM="Chrysochromulina brevifilum, Strain UTEX LB 985" /LENGTH=200 /DNA_ID=CAMNT_0015927255 /DNA_START=93 /DNA_END=695 /DNA_ORIENTATION=+